MKKIIIIIISTILFITLLFLFKEEKYEEYVIQDDYKLIISYPIIKDGKIDKKINDFIEENKKTYKKTKNDIENMIINYELQKYKDLTFIDLNSYIYYKDEIKEKNDVIAYKTDTKEVLELKDIFENTYYLSELTTLMSKENSVDLDYINASSLKKFILNQDGLVIKYNFLNKIKEIKIDYEQINKYLKDEYKLDILLAPKIIPYKRDLNKYKGKKLIALTFDDGPSNNTLKLLDELNKRDVKATFFVLGSRVGNFEDVIIKAYQDGHQIGSHTFSHKNLFYLTEEEIKNEIEKTNNAIYNVIGVRPTIIRVPYGNINSKIRSISDMNHILWNVDTLDWKYKNTNKVYKIIISKATDGDIILLHDIFKTSVNGVLKAIDELKKQGFEFVTIDEMVYLKGIKLDKSKTYFNF